MPFARRPTRARFLLLTLLIPLSALWVSSPAHAFGRKDLRSKLQQFADDALSAGKASSEQRAKIQPAINEVLRTAEDAFGNEPGTMPEMDDFLRLFAAEPLDAKALDTIRQRRDRRHKALADKLVAAFAELHATLDEKQREKVADWARKRTSGKRMKAFKDKVISTFVNAAIEDILGQIVATEPERSMVHGARDRVVGALVQAREQRQPWIDQLNAMFRAPTLDRAALDAVRRLQEQQVLELTQLTQRVFTELHAGLSPARRVRLVELIRDKQAHRPTAPSGEDTPF